MMIVVGGVDDGWRRRRGVAGVGKGRGREVLEKKMRELEKCG